MEPGLVHGAYRHGTEHVGKYREEKKKRHQKKTESCFMTENPPVIPEGSFFMPF